MLYSVIRHDSYPEDALKINVEHVVFLNQMSEIAIWPVPSFSKVFENFSTDWLGSKFWVSIETYVAYSVYFLLSSALTCHIPGAFTAGHISIPILTFVYLQFFMLFNWLKSRVSSHDFETMSNTLSAVFTTIVAIFLGAVLSGKIEPITDEHFGFLDPLKTKTETPVLASTTSNQPTAWAAFYFDSHFGVLSIPVGIYLLRKSSIETSIMLTLYACTGWVILIFCFLFNLKIYLKVDFILGQPKFAREIAA